MPNVLTRRNHRTYNDNRAVERDNAYNMHSTESRARERYGGINLGASFFGWIVASGLTLMISALLAALGLTAAINATQENGAAATANAAPEAGVVSIVALLIAMAVGYYAGGYVAGRMSRFDGARQGAGVFAIGLIAMVVLGALGAALGSQFNLLQAINLPFAVDLSSITATGILSAVLALIVMLVAAVTGGKVGENYHHKVDEAL